jgi:thiol:disulfide interchange protein DsbD
LRGGLAAVGLVALVVAGVSVELAASHPASPRVRVELLSEVQAIPAGETFWIALRQRIAPGWHTYWMNPGDSGEPVRIEWTMPPGFTAGEIAWPYPERIPVGPAMSFGYSNEVVLPVPVTAPADPTRGTRVTLRGQASWLVCEKTCIPEEAPVGLTLPVAAGIPPRDPRGAPLIAAARRAVPTRSPWSASFMATPEILTLTVAAQGLVTDRISEVWFFPARWGMVEHAAPQRSRADAEGITLELSPGPLAEAVDGSIEGVLVVDERLDGGTLVYAGAIDDKPTSRRSDVPGAHNYVRAALLAVATGQPVKTPVTRAYGCTVKYL